jgi:hypothetical protein
MQMYEFAVAEDNVQKNINQMGKSLKQVETDLKNAQQDKTADPNDKFVSVMSISLAVILLQSLVHCETFDVV